MRVNWRFLSLTLLGLAALAGCERAPEPRKEAEAVGYNLDGTWAWASEMNCYGNENTIVFAGRRIQVFERGKSKVSVPSADIREEALDGKPLLTIRYKLEGLDFEEKYLALDAHTLQPLETEVDGEPQISAGSDKRLLRCPAEALVPAPAR